MTVRIKSQVQESDDQLAERLCLSALYCFCFKHGYMPKLDTALFVPTQEDPLGQIATLTVHAEPLDRVKVWIV